MITESLRTAVHKRFKAQSADVFRRMQELEDQPKRGKHLATVGGVAVKELKHGSHRFYFVTDAHAVKFLKSSELEDLLIKFVRMSKKDDQQAVINDIKRVLQRLGNDGF